MRTWFIMSIGVVFSFIYVGMISVALYGLFTINVQLLITAGIYWLVSDVLMLLMVVYDRIKYRSHYIQPDATIIEFQKKEREVSYTPPPVYAHSTERVQ